MLGKGRKEGFAAGRTVEREGTPEGGSCNERVFARGLVHYDSLAVGDDGEIGGFAGASGQVEEVGVDQIHDIKGAH